MLVVPVLDLSQNQVVHAVAGERENYRPVQSILSTSAEPDSLLEAYFRLYPFKRIYIADLDAIQGTGNHLDWLVIKANQYPECEFWLDAGPDIENNYPSNANVMPVLGSENAMPEEKFRQLLQQYSNSILSLDFNRDGLCANDYLLDSTVNWPEKIIIMMLHRVGRGQGVDWKLLEQVRAIAKDHMLYAAGGIADMKDMEELAKSNVDGALIASALHQGKIKRQDIEQLHTT